MNLFAGLNYYGAVIPSKCLDKLVDKIPYSNPEYTIPPPSSADLEKMKARQQAMLEAAKKNGKDAKVAPHHRRARWNAIRQ